MSLYGVAHRLYNYGLNVVAICSGKKPCTSWSSDRRLEWEELERLLPRAEAIAVVGGPIEGEDYYLVPIDIDDPDVAHSIMSQVWGDDWQKVLCSSEWALCVKTGPRPKGQVQCEGDVCRTPEGEVPASQVKRGLAMVVRVPKNCAPQSSVRKGAIEVLAKNYQLVAGRHPSGLQYELISPNYGPGELVSCEELHRLLHLLSTNKDDVEVVSGRESEALGCMQWRQLTDDDKDALIEALKPLWKARDQQGRHYHDLLTYAVASIAARNCVAYEDIYGVFAALLDWAVKEGEDTERDVKHHLSVVDWVYGKGTARGTLWGRRRLAEIVEEAAQAVGEDPKQLLSMIQTAIGFDQTSKEECIVHKYIVKRGEGRRPVGLICNKRGRGIVYVTLNVKKRKIKTDGGETVEEEKTWLETVMLNAWLEEVTRYRDALLGIDYVRARVGTPEGQIVYHMARLEEFVESISVYREFNSDKKWEPLLTSGKYPLVEDAIVSGFVCDPLANVKCGVRDYFGVGIVLDPDPGKARRALELLDQAAMLHPHPLRFWQALALGAFTAFSFTQRRHNVRAKMVALVGPAQSGKTQVGKILNYMFAPRINTVYSVGRVFTPARLGRMLSAGHVLTVPVTLDEAYLLFTRPELTEILKHYVSSRDYAWETAHGQKWPATPGLILTANRLEITDPAVEDKVVLLEFPTPIPPTNKQKFHELIRELVEMLPHLGGYYLKHAEENWDTVKRIVISGAVENWEQAAIDYMLVIARQLGYVPETLADSTIVQTQQSSLLSMYLLRLLERAREWSHQACRDVADIRSCIEKLVENGYLTTTVKLYRNAKDGKDYYVLRDTFGLPTEALCAEIGGLVNKGRNAPFGINKVTYGKCIIEKEKFLALFDAEERGEEEAEEGEGGEA